MAKIFNARLVIPALTLFCLLLVYLTNSATFPEKALKQKWSRHRMLVSSDAQSKPIKRYYVAVSSIYSTREGITLSELARLAKHKELVILEQDTPALGGLLKTDLSGLAKGTSLAGLGREEIGIMRASNLTPGFRVLDVEGKSIWKDASYPLFANIKAEPGEEQFDPAQAIRLAAVGDIMLSRHVYKKMVARGFSGPFLSVAPRLSAADITLGNLETPLSNAFAPATHGMAFVTPKKAVRGLSYCGFDILSLANNHSTNFGSRALMDTLAILSQNQITHVGAGANESEAKSFKTLKAKGKTICFIAVNSIVGDQPAASARPGDWRISLAPWGRPKQKEIDELLGKVRQAKAAGDFVVVVPHWGKEYTLNPEPEVKSLARSLVAAGADLVIGSHPHWVQGVETYRGGFIAYSLGNFVFDQEWSRETKQGLILEVLFYKDRLLHAELTPVIIEDFHRPRILSKSQGAQILDAVYQSSMRLSLKDRLSIKDSGPAGGMANR